MVAYVFVLLGVVRERVALTVVFLDIILYSLGGVIGTMHHLYFSGEPAEHLALGAVFSAAEVIPLTFLTVEAWSFLQLGSRQESRSKTPFPHRWAVMFLVAVGFWNFLGAGIFGFLINLPIVSYYEIGTALTANHGHAAMMGVYGMLAVGLALFCLRYLIPDNLWPDRMAKWSFWSLNIGLAWMTFATLLPLGFIQLYESVANGYYEARSLEFLTNDTNALIEWIRLPGDILFIAGGVIPLVYICYLGVRYRVKKTTTEEPEDILFTEITAPTPETGRLDTSMRADRRRRPRRPGRMSSISIEVVGACAYALVLFAAALGLDAMARHSNRRSGRYRTAGFEFKPEHDLWICPEGQELKRHTVDAHMRVVRYRASPQTCNACPAKDGCTDSYEGRELVQPLDSWPHSEAGRFHRGISVVLVGARSSRPRDRRRPAPRARGASGARHRHAPCRDRVPPDAGDGSPHPKRLSRGRGGRQVKRAEELHPLSHDHHRALYAAMLLSRATRWSRLERKRCPSGVRQGLEHFALEERLPASGVDLPGSRRRPGARR